MHFGILIGKTIASCVVSATSATVTRTLITQALPTATSLAQKLVFGIGTASIAGAVAGLAVNSLEDSIEAVENLIGKDHEEQQEDLSN